MQPKQRPPVSRHVSAASIDTNASAIAESTISLGLSRFPEPPSSIPSTPVRSTPSSSLRGFASPSAPPVVPLRKIKPQDRANDPAISSIPSSNSGPSFKPTYQPAASPPDPPQPSSSSHIISAHDWHDGASSIDVDAAEDRLLPTSFITSLLQENQKLGKSKRGSYGSDAYSGISEMTYPPLINRAANVSSNHYASSRFPGQHRVEDSRAPPSSFTLPNTNRTSGDSETLHSLQGYPSIISTASVAKVFPGTRNSVIGVAPATLHSMSTSSQISSTRDSDTLGSITQGYQRKLSTAYETGDETTSDYKIFNPQYSQTATGGSPRRLLQDTSRQGHFSRDSVHSHQSAAPSFISRISSLRHVFNWRKTKPLPPVPKIPDISLAAENAYKKDEETTPLPDLVNRAGMLRELLDRGHHPHHSMNSYHVLSSAVDPSLPREVYEAEARKLGYADLSRVSQLSPLHKERSASPPMNSSMDSPPRRPRKRLRLWVILSIGILLLAAIGIGVGVTVGRKKPTEFNCPGNFTGSSCNLDASCACTSITGCNGLAQSIVNLLPTLNQAFDANITSAMAYTSIWIMQGSPTTRSCKSQALLIDVGTNLGQGNHPNRTQWAQAALLWNSIQTQDMVSAQQMQNSVQALPWKNIGNTDGPVVADPAFSITSSGFTFNFASQSLTQPSASFISLGQPPNAQIAQVSASANATLDRMYTYAQASATQRQTALKKYWASVLLRNPEDLPLFKAAFSISPIMLPFNASSPGIRNLYVSTPSASFPPPLSCFPGLSNSLLQAINTVESSVFGLQTASNAAQFDPLCYPERPVYGVLNLLRLRLPFLDSETGGSTQAVVLTRDASSRAVVYNGQIFSSISNASALSTTIASAQLNPRQYGTPGLSDHVILQYLTSIPDINTANNLIQFVLNTTNNVPVPPDTTSPLFQLLSALPPLEVAVFGSIQSSDLISTVSPFTNPSNSLFFGSPDGSALRNWTINSSSGSVIWTQNATSSMVAHDETLDPNASISRVWAAAALAIAFNVTNISLTNVTVSLQETNSFSSQ